MIETQLTRNIETSHGITNQEVKKAVPLEQSQVAGELCLGRHLVGETGNGSGQPEEFARPCDPDDEASASARVERKLERSPQTGTRPTKAPAPV